jgi:hypothetical protein
MNRALSFAIVGLFLWSRSAHGQEPAAASSPTSDAPTASAAPRDQPPAPNDSNEMVFHPAHGDMGALAAGSMQQMRIGTTKARYAMNIFGDVNFEVGSRARTHPSFALGTLSFLVTGELERHFVSTAEFALEYDDRTNQVGVDIERHHVGWLGEHFFVYAGRVHTAFGYWNNAYHHGKWLQPNMERPRWIAFEDSGGLLPIHTIGLSAGPIFPIGESVLKITLSVSNGRGNVVDDIRNRFDYQDSKALHAQSRRTFAGSGSERAGALSRSSRRIRPHRRRSTSSRRSARFEWISRTGPRSAPSAGRRRSGTTISPTSASFNGRGGSESPTHARTDRHVAVIARRIRRTASSGASSPS